MEPEDRDAEARSASSAARERMVREQLEARGVRDARVLQAMREVPREAFVPEELAEHAYDDSALPIESGQTISQPFMVAFMAEALEIRPGDRVLEVGTGSGYAAAVLSRLATDVRSIERHRAMADRARERLEGLGLHNVRVAHGDGSMGWPEDAPFDAIVVAAGGPSVPPALMRQLARDGRLVMPIGDAPTVQRLVRIRRTGRDRFESEPLSFVRFVPLIGEQGWDGGARAHGGFEGGSGGGAWGGGAARS